MACYKRAGLLSFRIRQVREVVLVYAKERCSGMKAISPLCIAMVLLALSSLFHVSSTETVHALRMLRGTEATPTSGETTQTKNIDETEFVHAGSMGYVLHDYPSSGANNRHSSYPEGSR